MREHGTHARYRSGCRCFHCRVAASDYERERRAGIRRTLDAGPVRAHILALVEAGMSRRGIAKAAGLSFNAVAELANGKTRRCSENTADRILGVTTRDRHEGHLYPSEVVEPMIEAMVRSGISRTRIAAMLGMESHWLSTGTYRRSTYRSIKRVETLYRLLQRHGQVPGEMLEELL